MTSSKASRSTYAVGGWGATRVRAAPSSSHRVLSSPAWSTALSRAPGSRPSPGDSGATLSRAGRQPVRAVQPPGRNFAAQTRPAPTRSMMKRRVATPCTRTAGIGTPKRGCVPSSSDRCTPGWLSTSERNAGPPARSHRTDQKCSTKGCSGVGTSNPRSRATCCAVRAGCNTPRGAAGAVAFVQDGSPRRRGPCGFDSRHPLPANPQVRDTFRRSLAGGFRPSQGRRATHVPHWLWRDTLSAMWFDPTKVSCLDRRG